jgi:hypothetical protein
MVRNQRSSYWRKQRGEERTLNYKAYCISEEKIQRLSDVGFPWESAFHAQQPQEDGSMVTTTPMMDAAATTAPQEEPRPHKRSVRKLVARKSSITGAASGCRQKSITATPAYTTNRPDSEHIVQQFPSKRTRLSYSAAAPGGAGTDHDEGAAVASRSDDHRIRKRRGSVSSDSTEHLSDSITAIQASSETIHFEDIVGHIQPKMQIEDIMYSLDPPEQSMDDLQEHEFTYLPSQPTSILMHGPSGCGKVSSMNESLHCL